MRTLLLGFVAGVICTLLVVGQANGGAANCHPARKCQTPTPAPTATRVPTPAPTAAASATPTSSPAYTFDDEFSGSSLSPVWLRHYSCCGTLAGYDSSLVSVSNGLLSISAVNRSGGWYSYLLDTKTTWAQQYGLFEARMQIPKGAGLWPAFWGYPGSGSAELDTMEVCANPLGANGGNDASLLHTTVHLADGSSSGSATRTGDLSAGFHTFGEDWRSDHVTFYLDSAAVWTYTGPTPAVAMPLIVNLGVGGSWCGSPTSSTQSPSILLVDWIRARS